MEMRISIEEAEGIIEEYLKNRGYRVLHTNLSKDSVPIGVKFDENQCFSAFIGGGIDENKKWNK